MKWKTRNAVSEVLSAMLVVLILAAIVAGIGGVMALRGHLLYDDWSCGFAKCVKVRP